MQQTSRGEKTKLLTAPARPAAAAAARAEQTAARQQTQQLCCRPSATHEGLLRRCGETDGNPVATTRREGFAAAFDASAAAGAAAGAGEVATSATAAGAAAPDGCRDWSSRREEESLVPLRSCPDSCCCCHSYILLLLLLLDRTATALKRLAKLQQWLLTMCGCLGPWQSP